MERVKVIEVPVGNERRPFGDVNHEGRWKMKPFAVQLYDRFLRGETVEQLAAAFEIPVERVAARIRAAESYTRQFHRNAA